MTRCKGTHQTTLFALRTASGIPSLTTPQLWLKLFKGVLLVIFALILQGEDIALVTSAGTCRLDTLSTAP